jgi:hypothetical protein
MARNMTDVSGIDPTQDALARRLQPLSTAPGPGILQGVTNRKLLDPAGCPQRSRGRQHHHSPTHVRCLFRCKLSVAVVQNRDMPRTGLGGRSKPLRKRCVKSGDTPRAARRRVAAALGAARVWGVRSEQRPREQLADRAAAGNPLRQFGERTVNRRNGSVVCACLVNPCLARAESGEIPRIAAAPIPGGSARAFHRPSWSRHAAREWGCHHKENSHARGYDQGKTCEPVFKAAAKKMAHRYRDNRPRPLDGHRVVEIGAVELIKRSPTGQKFRRYVCPQRATPADAVAVHGRSRQRSYCRS